MDDNLIQSIDLIFNEFKKHKDHDLLFSRLPGEHNERVNIYRELKNLGLIEFKYNNQGNNEQQDSLTLTTRGWEILRKYDSYEEYINSERKNIKMIFKNYRIIVATLIVSIVSLIIGIIALCK